MLLVLLETIIHFLFSCWMLAVLAGPAPFIFQFEFIFMLALVSCMPRSAFGLVCHHN